jgi:hypothetical protein
MSLAAVRGPTVPSPGMSLAAVRGPTVPSPGMSLAAVRDPTVPSPGMSLAALRDENASSTGVENENMVLDDENIKIDDVNIQMDDGSMQIDGGRADVGVEEVDNNGQMDEGSGRKGGNREGTMVGEVDEVQEVTKNGEEKTGRTQRVFEYRTRSKGAISKDQKDIARSKDQKAVECVKKPDSASQSSLKDTRLSAGFDGDMMIEAGAYAGDMNGLGSWFDDDKSTGAVNSAGNKTKIYNTESNDRKDSDLLGSIRAAVEVYSKVEESRIADKDKKAAEEMRKSPEWCTNTVLYTSEIVEVFISLVQSSLEYGLEATHEAVVTEVMQMISKGVFGLLTSQEWRDINSKKFQQLLPCSLILKGKYNADNEREG